MSAKRPQLDISALTFAGGSPANPVEVLKEKRSGRARQASRIGRVPVQAWIPEETRKRLRMTALRMDKNVDELLHEMILDFLGSHRS